MPFLGGLAVGFLLGFIPTVIMFYTFSAQMQDMRKKHYDELAKVTVDNLDTLKKLLVKK